jgi:hypothetical protein
MIKIILQKAMTHTYMYPNLLISGNGNFSFYHRVKPGSGAHPASHTMDIGGSFLEGKAAEA